ncbi:hypothetical protein SOVF_174550 isoform B [Spinacia oleracea]|uniref:Multiple organellar RNA editing factor 3, mitochondrial isoform X2 n=1 Tax=Spinacia oleracea TaxID=3562 RepID=A0ABM3RAS9_SPIOL|nr:multiple organellar RNA editing factor 3, mitochondrial-like isoform X2 [Spinacia oleracea]KNA07147.1 hypothetical protein SOVF_174550 isoform B [Spinacia oleracea]
MEFPTDPKPSNEEIIDSYVNTLNPIVGSEKEAKKIYSVSTTTYTGYGALISKEMTYKVKAKSCFSSTTSKHERHSCTSVKIEGRGRYI